MSTNLLPPLAYDAARRIIAVRSTSVADDRLHTEAFATLLIRMRVSPASVIEVFSHPKHNDEDFKSSNSIDSLLLSPAFVADALGYLLMDPLCTQFLDTEHFLDIMNAGLAEALIDTMLAKDYDFDQDQEYFKALVTALTGVLLVTYKCGTQGHPTSKAILARTTELWTFVWLHRESFDYAMPDMPDALDLSDTESGCKLAILNANWGLLTRSAPDDLPPLSSHLAHFALLAWVRFDIQDVYNSLDLLNREEISTEYYTEFVETVIIDCVGTTNLFAHVLKCLSAPVSIKDTREHKQYYMSVCVDSLVSIFHCDALLPYIGEFKLLPALVDCMDRTRSQSEPRFIPAYQHLCNAAINVLGLASRNIRLDRSGSSIHGDLAVHILASGLDIIAIRRTAPFFTEGQVGHVLELLRVFTHIAAGFPPNDPRFPGCTVLFKEFRDGAQRDWWSTYQRLETSAREDPSDDLVRNAKSTWSSFGHFIGYDVKAERKRHEKEQLQASRRHCAWRECRYYKDELAEERLKACTGCGTARYCGTKCQKSHWPEHKKKCKMLKA